MSDGAPPPGYQIYASASVGHLAWQALAASQRATVLGATSRGLFLRCESRWLAFVSYEGYRSPLTITLQQGATQLRALKVGAPLHIQPGLLLFPAEKIGVQVDEDRIWHPALPSGELGAPAQRLASLRTAAKMPQTEAAGRGFGPLLDSLLALADGAAAPLQPPETLETVLELQQALRRADLPGALGAAQALLGLGPGLTASGDDFLIGLLLMLKRWPALHTLRQTLALFNDALIAAAYEKTTTLSANLIECATRGESDERLLAMVDGLATGAPSPAVWLPPLANWGASSGIDALAGVALALYMSLS